LVVIPRQKKVRSDLLKNKAKRPAMVTLATNLQWRV